MIPVGPRRYDQDTLGQDPAGPVRLQPPVPRQEEAIAPQKRPEKIRRDAFAPKYVWNEGSGFTLIIQQGRIEEVTPQSGTDCVLEHNVTWAGADRQWEEWEVGVPDGHTVYVKVPQDLTGAVINDEEDYPELLVGETVPDSDHWYPVDPGESGSGGTMYFKLYKVESIDGVAELTLFHWGPIIIRSDLWTGQNVGSGKRVFQRHAETEGAVYKFRTLTEGDGITLTYESGDTEIKIEADAEAHPWKVTSNGDGTVNVAKGAVGWWDPQTDILSTAQGDPGVIYLGTMFLHEYYKQVATASVTVTGTGYIIFGYDSALETPLLAAENITDWGDLETHGHGQYSSGGTVKFTTTPASESFDIVLVIAEVSLDAAVAQVDEQIITHNPIVHQSIAAHGS